MKTLQAIVVLAVLLVPTSRCMSQTGADSPSESKTQTNEVELLSFGEDGLRVRSSSGDEEFFPLDDLQAYRLMNGKLDVKHISGKIITLPPEALGDSTSLREGQWQVLSTDDTDTRYVDVETVGHDDELCLKSLDGKSEYEIGELVAYRVKNGKVQMQHESGTVLVASLESASNAKPETSAQWRILSGDDSTRRQTLFSQPRGGAKVSASSLNKEFSKALGELPGEIPTSLIVLGAAWLVVNIAYVLCFGLVILAMFLNGEIGTGLLCVILTCVIGCGPWLALYQGWKNCQAWRIRNLMIVWSVLWVVGIALSIILLTTFPDLVGLPAPSLAGH